MIKLLYFRVMLLLALSFGTIPLFSQSTPVNVGLVCSNQEITNNTPPVSLTGVSVRSSCATGYTNRISFTLVQIRSGSTFTFQITPSTGSNFDYDFISWKNPNLSDIHNITVADINNLGPGDRGNRNTGGQGRTIGLSMNATTLCRGVEGDGLERYYDVVPGDIILIAIDKYGSGVEDPYDISFGGNSVLDCYFGKTFFECVDETTNLATFNLDSFVDEIRPPNNNSPYYFYETEEDAESNLPENRIGNIQQIPYTEEGKEIFVAFVQSNNQTEIVKFSLQPLAPLNTTSDTIYGCFAGENPQTHVQLGLFDLGDAIPASYLTDTLISTKIYRTQAQAEANGTAGLIAQSSWQNYSGINGVLYYRLEYDLGDETKCSKIIPVNLQIVRVELAETLKTIQACFEEIVDLTQFQPFFVPGENTYEYKYYKGTTLITNPSSYEILSSSDIRVVIGNGSCIEEAIIKIQLQETPIIEFGESFIVCDNDFDNALEVDLDLIRAYLLDNTGEFNYSFYHTQEDGAAQLNAIEGTHVSIPEGETLWVRANNEGNCFSLVQVPLEAGEKVNFIVPTTALAVCASEEGIATFDLTTSLPQLTLPDEANTRFFPSNEDAIALTNEIVNPNSWQTDLASGSIYLRLNQEGYCDNIVPIEFTKVERPVVEIPNAVTVCEGQNYILDLSTYGDYTFTVSGDVTEIRTKVYEISSNGEYSILASNSFGCESTILFNLNVITQPEFAPFAPIALCDENFDGTFEADVDGLKTLAQANVGAGFEIKVYPTEDDAIALTNEILTPTYTFMSLPNKLWIRAQSQGECFTISSVDYVANDAVTFTPPTQVLEICGTLNTIGGTLDLTTMVDQFNLEESVGVKYYSTLADAQQNVNEITTPHAYVVNANQGSIYVRFEKEGLCSAITSFNFKVNEVPTISIDTSVEICGDQSHIVDLSSYANYNFEISGGTYNELRPKVYEFNTAGTYTITVSSGVGCSNQYNFDVVINPLPEFTSVNSFNVCDANVDGNYELDLIALADAVIMNHNGITLNFYKSEADLLADMNEITGELYETRLPAKIWVRATTAAGCSIYKSIDLVEGNTINIAPATTPLQVCANEDGTAEFDLTLIENQLNIPTGYMVAYYPTLRDLQNGTNEITAPTVWNATHQAGTLFIKFEAAGLCPGYTTFDYIVNDAPAIELEEIYYICNEDEFVLDLSSYNDLSFNVTGAGNVANLGGNKFRLSTIGMYTVVANNQFGCSSEYAFELSNFGTPIVSEIIVGASTITVRIVRDPSHVNVQYSLDGLNFQSSNVLAIPETGKTYGIYVKIENCTYFLSDVEVIQIPTFFSPNNDGYNDVWRIKPILLSQEVDLKIYDRFGKIIYEQSGNEDIVWDGTFNGKKLPTTDYWFTIDVKGDGIVRAIKYTGSITLKNK